MLEQTGYTIIERNWRCERGELDIVARHRDELVFVEVRSRADDLGTALESISPRKQKQLIALAEAYLVAHDLDLQNTSFRIDVAAVNRRTGAVEVIEHAVGW
jgi:putative endonuclease